MPELKFGMRSARDSTPVPDNTMEPGEIREEMEADEKSPPRLQELENEMDIDKLPSSGSHEPSSPSPVTPLPCIEHVPALELRQRSGSRASPVLSRSTSPSLVHSPDEHIMSTEYIPVPPRNDIAVMDVSQQHTKCEWYTGDPQTLVRGSDRGRYLDDFNEDLRLQMQDIRDAEREKPPHLRKPKNDLAKHDTSRSWDQKFARRLDAASSTCPWMNETWGPPIENPLDLAARSPGGTGHPSTTHRLNAQYGAISPTSMKRSSIDNGVTGSPGKKPRLKLTVRPPVKEHKKFTSPQLERSGESHPLLAPKPSPPRKPTICSNCKRHEDLTPLYLCDKCGQNAYCSRRCETTYAPLHTLSCKPTTPQSPQTADLSHLSIMDSPRNYAPDDDVVMTTEVARPPLKPRQILDFRVIHSRTMEYSVAGHSGSLWQTAESLLGDKWTAAMHKFWESTTRNKLWRRFAERPHEVPTGQIGRFVIGVLLEDERSLSFDVRDFDDTLEDDWRTAEELGAE
ncbi:hypothetical protein LTR29_000582 [Friedmanniomyces endolithicus]|nr:hypothetical protein LTR29_000582 [Friedmanniomyces endolithicus]